MVQNDFMNVLTLILICILLIVPFINVVKKYFPVTAWEPFKRFSEVAFYYVSSVSIIRSKLWILILPLGFAISQNFIFQLFAYFLYHDAVPDIPGQGIDIMQALVSQPFISNVIVSIVNAPILLDYGFNRAISQNAIFIILFIVGALTYGPEIKRLKKYSTNENLKNVSFIEKNLKISLMAIIVMVLFALALYFSKPLSGFSILCYAILGISGWVLSLLCLSVFSFLEAFILFSVYEAIEQKCMTYETLLNKSLAVTKPLFKVNVILYLVGAFPSIMMLPNTLAQFINFQNTMFYKMTELLPIASQIYLYFFSFLMAFIFAVPFSLVLSDEAGVYNGFKKNFFFIRDHFLKYIIFAGLGVVILSIPSLMQSVLNLFINQHSFQIFLMKILTTILTVVFAVVFYVAMFKFYHDYSRERFALNLT